MAFFHEHIILPLSDLMKGEKVHKYLRLLREAESWSPAQMHDFQQQRLRELIVYASKQVPFYQDWFASQHIDPNTVALDQLPIVSKHIMRKEGIERFTAEHFPEKERIQARSSGSTGEPFSFYISKLSNSVNTAAKLRTWYQAGYRLGDRYMKIANAKRPNMPKQLQDWSNNCIYIPFYSITEANIRTILERIEISQPKFIRSYPSPLFILAQYRNSHPGFTFNPRHIMTTGSTLTDAYRTEIEKAFGCDIIDSYSCEGNPNTYETTDHDGYHTTDYYGIIEVLDSNNQPVSDGIGRVVSTDLWNLAHPFIRYDTQDFVEVQNGTITRIIGRQSDVYIKGNGTIFTVHNFSHYFLHEIVGVDNYQIRLHGDNSLTILLVTNNYFHTECIQDISNYWSQQLSTQVNVLITDNIPLMKNNKHLTIVKDR